ncbi:MAG: hypothetical protein LBU65_09360 [Planctomycetaceae bacterium]|jgi:hypothetical protein|nr:hypothetical protein [Planctomycetaceae bacterium]
MTTTTKSMLEGNNGSYSISEFLEDCAKAIRCKCPSESKKPIDVIREIVNETITRLGLSEKTEELVPYVCSVLLVDKVILLDIENNNYIFTEYCE